METEIVKTQAAFQTIDIEGPNGILVADLHKPELSDGEKAPLTILMHGFKATRRGPLLDAIFNTLASRGLGVLRFDFDGCGESEGKFSDMTVPKEINDALAVYENASQLPWVSEIYIVGHSQGGVVASMTAGKLSREKVAALALLAPAAVLREDAIRGNTQGAHYDSLNPPETVEVAPGFTIGRDYITTARNLPIYDTACGYQGPAIMVHGTGDIVVPYTYSLRYKEIFRNGTVRLLPGVTHLFTTHEQEAADIVALFLTTTSQCYCL